MGMRAWKRKILLQENLQKAETAEHVAKVMESTTADILAIAFTSDLTTIKAQPTIEMRLEKKKEFIKKWQSTVDKYLCQDEVYQNDLLCWFIVFLFDLGEFTKALDLSDIAIRQGQQLPFKSTFPTFIADTIFKWSEHENAMGHKIEPYFSRVFENIINHWKIHEMAKSKWLKLAGCLLVQGEKGEVSTSKIEDPNAIIYAVYLWNNAFTLNHKIGVKSMIERAFMRLRALEKQGIYTPKGDLAEEIKSVDFKNVLLKFTQPQSALSQPEDEKEVSNV